MRKVRDTSAGIDARLASRSFEPRPSCSASGIRQLAARRAPPAGPTWCASNRRPKALLPIVPALDSRPWRPSGRAVHGDGSRAVRNRGNSRRRNRSRNVFWQANRLPEREQKTSLRPRRKPPRPKGIGLSCLGFLGFFADSARRDLDSPEQFALAQASVRPRRSQGVFRKSIAVDGYRHQTRPGVHAPPQRTVVRLTALWCAQS